MVFISPNDVVNEYKKKDCLKFTSIENKLLKPSYPIYMTFMSIRDKLSCVV